MNISKNTQIFATGVHLQAVECTINDIKQWRWVAVSFEDDSFMNGQIVEPIEYANEMAQLIEIN